MLPNARENGPWVLYVEPGRGGEGRGGGVEQPVTVYIVSGESVGWHSRDLTFCIRKKKDTRGESRDLGTNMLLLLLLLLLLFGEVLFCWSTPEQADIACSQPAY